MSVDSLQRAVVALFALLALAAKVDAQSVEGVGNGAAEPAGYRDTVKQGTAEYELGNFAEARSLFERAHSLYPNARTLRALGLAEFELRNYPESARHLRAALASDVKPLTGDTRKSVEELLQRAEGFLGKISIDVEPTTASVLLDGQPLEEREDTMSIAVGDHVLEFAATGYATQRRRVRIVGGEQQQLRVVLSPLQVAAASEGLPSERKPGAAPIYKKWWLWTTVGVAVLGAAAVTSYFLLRPEQDGYRYRTTATTPAGYGVMLAAPRAR